MLLLMMHHVGPMIRQYNIFCSILYRHKQHEFISIAITSIFIGQRDKVTKRQRRPRQKMKVKKEVIIDTLMSH
jgi:hypothetical protein